MNPQVLAWCSGLIGVIIFSGSLPATRIAVMDMNPWFLTGSRAVIAGVIAVILLKYLKVNRPDRQDRIGLVYVALGVVIGFPLFTALALQYINASYSIVFVGLLPLSTAIFAVIRGGEKPKAIFWVFHYWEVHWYSFISFCKLRQTLNITLTSCLVFYLCL